MNKQDWQDSFFYINNEPKTHLTMDQERALFDLGIIKDCEFEFGPHDEHEDCARMIGVMGLDFENTF